MVTKVYHAKEKFFRDTMFYGDSPIIDVETMLKGLDNGTIYMHVADVHIGDLNTAYRLTQHLMDNWTVNSGVTHVPTKKITSMGYPRYRSTSVGDLIVVDDKVYAVASMGFDLIREAS